MSLCPLLDEKTGKSYTINTINNIPYCLNGLTGTSIGQNIDLTVTATKGVSVNMLILWLDCPWNIIFKTGKLENNRMFWCFVYIEINVSSPSAIVVRHCHITETKLSKISYRYVKKLNSTKHASKCIRQDMWEFIFRKIHEKLFCTFQF